MCAVCLCACARKVFITVTSERLLGSMLCGVCCLLCESVRASCSRFRLFRHGGGVRAGMYVLYALSRWIEGEGWT